jgi:hypothetical protein
MHSGGGGRGGWGGGRLAGSRMHREGCDCGGDHPPLHSVQPPQRLDLDRASGQRQLPNQASMLLPRTKHTPAKSRGRIKRTVVNAGQHELFVRPARIHRCGWLWGREWGGGMARGAHRWLDLLQVNRGVERVRGLCVCVTVSRFL